MPINENDRKNKPTKRHPSFEIDDRLHFAIEYNLAMDIKDYILSHGHPNPAVMAFAYELQNIERENS